jgi:neutral ceramidase
MQSIIQAHDHLEDGSVALTQGELLNTNINRSPKAYILNPFQERSLYKYDVDKTMTVLSFKNKLGRDLGLVSW